MLCNGAVRGSAVGASSVISILINLEFDVDLIFWRIISRNVHNYTDYKSTEMYTRMPDWGPPIKYVTLEGEGIREGVTVCDRGGKEHVTSHLYIFLSYIWNIKFKVMFNFLL